MEHQKEAWQVRALVVEDHQFERRPVLGAQHGPQVGLDKVALLRRVELEVLQARPW